MYIDYNMAEIALMVCAVSSLLGSVGGGFYMFKKEQENAAKEELIAEKKALDAVTGYFECDYKGGDSIAFSDDIETTPPRPIKSIIVPAGFSVDTYPKENKSGTKITLGGPSDQKCTSIKSMVVTKV
tara:strand:- start:37 stop:417 length:381 start_codon:yes stop_codon:yes gene_type:complete